MTYDVTEKVFENNIKKYLDTLPKCWYFKVHGGPYQKSGIPDIVGVYRGRFFGIEVKKPGEKATPLQAFIISQMIKAGGLAGVVVTVEDAERILHVEVV